MNLLSPVPRNQQPVEEYIVLTKSWFFSYLQKGNKIYFLLIVSWILSVLFYMFVGTGSSYLQHHKLLLLSQSLSFSLIIPLTLCYRLFLGWNYIYNRLKSEVIIYEESDWHDGQIWKKPTSWIEREKLIATIEINPLLKTVKRISFVLMALLTIGISIDILIQFNQ